jgi:hypothetical protein
VDLAALDVRISHRSRDLFNALSPLPLAMSVGVCLERLRREKGPLPNGPTVELRKKLADKLADRSAISSARCFSLDGLDHLPHLLFAGRPSLLDRLAN